MTTPRRADGFVSRDFDEETIVVPVRAGVANLEKIFSMNAVGAAIWRRIDGQATVSELARALADEYAVSEADAAADVAEFLALLSDKGLVVAGEARK